MTSDAAATFELPTIVRFAEIALSALGAAREEIDALNVYPVPDGDTGTNLFLTVEAARNAMLETTEGDPEGDVRKPLAAFARGALLGARGNSGVILSQLIGAVVKHIGEARPGDRSAVVFADALSLAAEAAYAAVGQPVEGTILSVAKAAAEGAQVAARNENARLGHVIRAAASMARDALDRTPEQLQILKDAGVVDAGGRGLCVILDAAETAVTGKRPVGSPTPFGTHAIPVPLPTGDLTEGGPGYEVMYLLDAQDDRIGPLRRRLAPLGDSLVVVGGDGLWNVHVHVDDVGAAVEAGIEAGHPYRIRVTHFAEQAGHPYRIRVTHFAEQAGRRATGSGAAEKTGRRVVVIAAGAGLEGLFAEAGASVVPSRQGRRPSTGEILEAISACGAAEVIVMPNDGDCIAVAEAAAKAAREDGTTVAVIPTRAQVQGLAALAVHEPARSFDEDMLQMTAAARHARHGAVTIAARQAITTAGPCEPGDVLGAIEGDFALVGKELFAVATGVLERLLGGGGELVTVVFGPGSGDLADRCASYLSSEHPTVDVVVYDGGQERYPLLVAVE